MGLCRSSKLLLGTCNYGEPHASPLKQRKGKLREGEVGRGCYKQKVHCGKLGVGGTVSLHWLSWDSPSLAEQLPGEENIFLPLNDGGKAASDSAGDGKHIASYWVIKLSGVCMRAPPSGLLIPFQWRFLWLIFRRIKMHWMYCLVFSLFLLDYWKFWSIEMLCFNRSGKTSATYHVKVSLGAWDERK